MADVDDLFGAIVWAVTAGVLGGLSGYQFFTARKQLESSSLLDIAHKNSQRDSLPIDQPVIVRGTVALNGQRALVAVDGSPAAFVFSQQGRKYLQSIFAIPAVDVSSYKAVEVPWKLQLLRPVHIADRHAHLQSLEIQPGLLAATATQQLLSLAYPSGTTSHYGMLSRSYPPLSLASTYQVHGTDSSPQAFSLIPAHLSNNIEYVPADLPREYTDTWLTRVTRFFKGYVADGCYTYQRYLPLGTLVSVVGKLVYSFDGSETSIRLGPLTLGDKSMIMFDGSVEQLKAYFLRNSRLYTAGGLITATVAGVCVWASCSMVSPHRIVSPWDWVLRHFRNVHNEALLHADEPVWQPNGLVDGADLHGQDELGAEGVDCIVCRVNRPIVSFVPCGHLCMCIACSQRMLDAANEVGDGLRCAICNEASNGVIRVFGLPELHPPANPQ